MILAVAVVVGLVVGLVLGGRVGRLAELPLRGLAWFWVVIALQVLAFPVVLPWQPPEIAATGVWLGTYVVLFVIAGLNRHITGFPIAALGMLSNVAAIAANGGHMPALPSALRDAGVVFDGVRMNSVADASPHLAWLVDRWAVPSFLPLGNVFSVGDVLLGLGAIVIVVAGMGVRLPRPLRSQADGQGD